MKNRKTLFIVGGAVLAVIIAVVVIVCSVGGKKTDVPQVTPGTDSEVTTSELKIDDPETDGDPTTETTLDTSAVPDDGNALTLEDEPMPVSTGKTGTQGKSGQTAKPVTEKTPTDDGNGNGGISIGGGQSEKYDCGTPGHHCDGPETHAYILNLELDGCPYCGKHDCPSFYATDEWGNTCYTPNKCPKYDVHKDPVYYCQDCGRPTGDGSNGTCVQYVESCNCPICGKWVEGWTCHTH